MTWVNVAGGVESVATSLALLVGGAWAYVRFVGGRIGQPSIALRVSGKTASSARGAYLCIVASVKNAGTSVVRIEHSDTGIAVYGESGGGSTPEWNDLAAVDAFSDSDMVEPNQEIVEQHLLRLPCKPSVALKVEVHVQTKASLLGFGRASRWTTSTVILPPNLEESNDHGPPKHHSDHEGEVEDKRAQGEICADDGFEGG